MTVSKPPIVLRNAARRLPSVISFIVLVAIVGAPVLASAQDSSRQETSRYVRLFLRDKGTTRRFLAPGDPLYPSASSHLTARALRRRAKVLPAAQIVSTDDLPINPPYLQAIAATGAVVAQTSRWLNTVMVLADSMTIERLRRLPFLDSLDVVRAAPRTAPLERPSVTERLGPPVTASSASSASECFADHYGLADFQNRFMGIDVAHRIGIAGEGILVGVLDAGFDWRGHRAFARTNVVGEYDFIHGNANTANEPEDSLAVGSQEEHGTMVLSLMGATWSDTLVGGAPAASFLLAKTEDLRFERHVEEDNFVAGLEWLEAQGVDITNTSLGYTGFDEPERSHVYEDLTGHTVPASRAVNHAVSLGVVCVLAAGNEGRLGSFMYTGVPAEADSAIAAAAVDSNGNVAGFSSRGMLNHPPQKPDVAAFGVGNWAAHPSGSDRLIRSQGTSFASPMTAAVATLVLSAAPELRPWELREILERSATRAVADTAVGYGIVNAGRALRELARRRTVVGLPVVALTSSCVSIAAYSMRLASEFSGASLDSHLVVRLTTPSGRTIEMRGVAPGNGLGRWVFPPLDDGSMPGDGDAIVIEFLDASSGAILRHDSLVMRAGMLTPSSTTCARADLALVGDDGIEAYPNPFDRWVRLSFELERDDAVTLTIYNSAGQQVVRLYDGEPLAAGCHAPMFDAHGLPNGSYYVQLRGSDGSVRSGSMIYLP
jgi:subtilisin family serine protease